MAKIADKTIVYITRDLERALGQQTVVAAYFIITNSTPFAKEMSRLHHNIVLIDSPEILDTHELLVHPDTEKFLNNQTNPLLLVFKNTTTIEHICKTHGWTLLNPPAILANQVEEKISQVAWLDDLARFLPKHHIQVLKDVTFTGKPFILQFNRAHTGSGTILIDNETILSELKEKFPERPVRITAYISGTMITSNNIVFADTIMVGNPNVQITGLSPFTDKPFATVGNDWALGNSILSEAQQKQYNAMVTAIGEKLRASGWRGLFGIDCMLGNDGQLYVIEINARQPAGTTFESQLQQKSPTVFDAHIWSLLGEKAENQTLTSVTDGAQIILRNQTNVQYTEATLTIFVSRLESLGFTVTRYYNTEPGSDLVRIQSPTGLMKSPTQLNERGESIVNALNCSI